MSTRQNIVFCGLIVLLAVVSIVQSRKMVTLTEAVTYLSEFGYLPPSVRNTDNGNLIDNDMFIKALQDFQRFNNLEITGELDEATKNLMSLPRCGVPDKEFSEDGVRKKRYDLWEGKIHHNNITYRVYNYPSTFNNDNYDIEIARAFALWSEVTDLNFTKKDSDPVDIKISFERRQHESCRSKFDGPGGKLGHASSPRHGSVVHFDIEEPWNIATNCGINFFHVAAHEFGHALGLDHTSAPMALMAAYYNDTNQVLRLHDDDIYGIQLLYGARTPQSGAFGGIPQEPLDDDLCRDPKIDTIFKSNDDREYIFKGNKYYENILYFKAYGYPMLISEGWPGLTDNIDAAFTDNSGKTYFFKGSQYWRYNGRVMDDGYPKKINETFPGLFNNLDAAAIVDDKNYVYFFKGNERMLYHLSESATYVPFSEEPYLFGLWYGVINAAFYSGNILHLYINYNETQYLIPGFGTETLQKYCGGVANIHLHQNAILYFSQVLMTKF